MRRRQLDDIAGPFRVLQGPAADDHADRQLIMAQVAGPKRWGG